MFHQHAFTVSPIRTGSNYMASRRTYLTNGPGTPQRRPDTPRQAGHKSGRRAIICLNIRLGPPGKRHARVRRIQREAATVDLRRARAGQQRRRHETPRGGFGHADGFVACAQQRRDFFCGALEGGWWKTGGGGGGGRRGHFGIKAEWFEVVPVLVPVLDSGLKYCLDGDGSTESR